MPSTTRLIPSTVGGLPSGMEAQVFDPYVHGEASEGTGLGLAIVAGIARAHGGSAGVDNRPGDGATFWVRIPRSPAGVTSR